MTRRRARGTLWQTRQRTRPTRTRPVSSFGFRSRFRRAAAETAKRRAWRPPPVPVFQDYEQEPMRPVGFRRTGPMTIGELYEYHKNSGTLEVFFAMFPGL